MTWRDRPARDRFYALRYNGLNDRWEKREVEDLRKGDIFKLFTPGGAMVHPVIGAELAPDLHACAALADTDAYKNEVDDLGWIVDISCFEPFHMIVRRLAH